jgi:hypothetical protein
MSDEHVHTWVRVPLDQEGSDYFACECGAEKKA